MLMILAGALAIGFYACMGAEIEDEAKRVDRAWDKAERWLEAGRREN